MSDLDKAIQILLQSLWAERRVIGIYLLGLFLGATLTVIVCLYKGVLTWQEIWV